MEIALFIGAIWVLLMVVGKSKTPQTNTNHDYEETQIRIVIDRKGSTSGPAEPEAKSVTKEACFNQSPSGAETTHGLIIGEPWVSKILEGEKCWEMRSTRTKRRGPIALIKKGSKTVVGVCELTDVHGPFDSPDLEKYRDKHRVPKSIYEAPDYKWRYAWELSNVRRLTSPLTYQHRSGSVIWVALDDNARRVLNTDFAVPRLSVESDLEEASEIGVSGGFLDNEVMLRTAPFDRDGSFFCPKRCSKHGRYWVVSKFGELEFAKYDDALEYLSNMDVARWKSPGPNGKWRTVSAVGWKSFIQE